MAAARKKHVVSGKVCLNCVVKRKGELEEFDERKVYSSVYEAAMSSHYSEKKAEELADNVTKLVEKKFKKAHEIDSRQIFEHVVESLEKFDKEVAFMYETHRDLS
ncbi:MAG TPA: ATP cone domain-containing protein [archaeon]|nr:ATP cone domain-containing protein [archaeon]